MGVEFKKALYSVRGSLRPPREKEEGGRREKERGSDTISRVLACMNRHRDGTDGHGADGCGCGWRVGRLPIPTQLADTVQGDAFSHRERTQFSVQNCPRVVSVALFILYFLAAKRGAIRMMGSDGRQFITSRNQ